MKQIYLRVNMLDSKEINDIIDNNKFEVVDYVVDVFMELIENEKVKGVKSETEVMGILLRELSDRNELDIVRLMAVCNKFGAIRHEAVRRLLERNVKKALKEIFG